MKGALSARRRQGDAKRQRAAPGGSRSEAPKMQRQLSEASMVLSGVEASVTTFTQQLSAGSSTVVPADKRFNRDISTKTTSNIKKNSPTESRLVVNGNSAEAMAQECCMPTINDGRWDTITTKLLKRHKTTNQDDTEDKLPEEQTRLPSEVVTMFERAERAREIVLDDETRKRYYNEFSGGSANFSSRDTNEVY
jgi:hypothetical protein